MTSYFKFIFFVCICNSISNSLEIRLVKHSDIFSSIFLGNAGHGFLRKDYSQNIARTTAAIDFSHDFVSAIRPLWSPVDPPHETPPRHPDDPPPSHPDDPPRNDGGSRQPIVPGQPIGPVDPTIQPPQAGDEQIPVVVPVHRENRDNTWRGYLENMSIKFILISMSLTASVTLFCCMCCIVKTCPGLFNRAERPINPSSSPSEEEQQAFARSLAGGFYDSIEMINLPTPVSRGQESIHTWNLRRNRF